MCCSVLILPPPILKDPTLCRASRIVYVCSFLFGVGAGEVRGKCREFSNGVGADVDPILGVGNENSAQSSSDQSFWKSLRVVDVRAFGSWMSAPRCLFSRILSALTEVLGQDIRANDPRMSAGYPSQKLPLRAAFSFLKEICRRLSQRILPANFSREFFGLVSPGLQAPQTNSRPKFTPRTDGFLSNIICLISKMFHADFCLRGRSILVFPRQEPPKHTLQKSPRNFGERKNT